MNDQAQQLRKKYRRVGKKTPIVKSESMQLKIIAVTSGKGGVGKSNLSLNLGIALAKKSQKTLIVDADLNLGNIDVLLGLNPQFTLRNVISGEKQLEDIIIKGPKGVKIVPTTSGAMELMKIGVDIRKNIIHQVNKISSYYDYLIIDTPAGIGPHVYDFLEIADKIMIVTSPDPSAIIDAYAMVKLLWSYNFRINIELVVNFVASKDEAKDVFDKMNLVTLRYLNHKIEQYSFILTDENVLSGVKEQKPFIIRNPKSLASLCITRICYQIIKEKQLLPNYL